MSWNLTEAKSYEYEFKGERLLGHQLGRQRRRRVPLQATHRGWLRVGDPLHPQVPRGRRVLGVALAGQHVDSPNP
uniref:Uncharacterized protein n=1 Tax=Oryza meridionalis TaxID=40149 RepID=A0A0E0E563_9ORYZ